MPLTDRERINRVNNVRCNPEQRLALILEIEDPKALQIFAESHKMLERYREAARTRLEQLKKLG